MIKLTEEQFNSLQRLILEVEKLKPLLESRESVTAPKISSRQASMNMFEKKFNKKYGK